MISELTIQNFQSHKKSVLNFDEGVNVIIGNSDCGKTAIIRALVLVATNKPSGQAYCRRKIDRGDTVGVTLVTSNGDTILRTERPEKLYELNNTQFKAFGTDVPEEIQQALNMNEINLQAQFDQPFLLTSTSGEVAAHFNRIAHIDQIDIATKKVNGWINNINSVLGHPEEKDRPATGLNKTLKELNESLESFPDMEKLEIDIEALEEMSEKRQAKINRQSKLGSLITSIQDTEKEIETKSKILKLEKSVNNLFELIEQQEEQQKQYDSLSMLVIRVQKTTTKIKEQQELLTHETTVNSILKLYEERETLVEAKIRLNKAVSGLNNTNLLLERERLNLSTQNALFERKMPDICPLCETNLKKR
jgi:predicted ATP-dependent endonuclease of OLD family